jgi:UDP-N-acetylmuramyl tripeptide synthase
MLLVDPRRLTGPNLLARTPLVVVELALDVADVLEHARDVYLQELGRMRAALGFFHEPSLIVRAHRGGAVFAYVEPIDVMLACTEMSEWAALSACEILGHRSPLPIEPKATEIEMMLAHDRSPRLLALEAEARRRGLPFLWDDEEVSVGAGAGSETWPRHAAPDVADVRWDSLRSIPIALVTGTNGKTTSTRILARLVKESGVRVGSTSSDGVEIGERMIEEGDWTGPVAARTVLRRKDVDVAVLETARGGILRRGLAMEWCDAALVTNVSEDHTGGYGIDDLAAMTRVKAVPARAVRKSGMVVLNAQDPKLVALAHTFDPAVMFFADLDVADDAAKAAVDAHLRHGGRAVVAENGAIVSAAGDRRTALLGVAEVPVTFGGAARHNVENALGAAAAAVGLGVPHAAVVRGLRGFSNADNPSRGQVLEHAGVRLMLDFGHNPEGVRKILWLVDALRAGVGRLFVSLASAGDRSDHEIGEMSRWVATAAPELVMLRELPGYLRGRLPGDVPRIFEHSLEAFGFPRAKTVKVASEVESLRIALGRARAGDFVLVLVHLEREEVRAFLAAEGFTGAETPPRPS